jgi:serine protease AprX
MKRALGRLVLAVLFIFTQLPNSATIQPPNYPTIPLSNSATISPHVLAAIEGGASASFLVIMREQADVGAAASLPTKSEKGRFVYETLRQTALRTQAPLRAELDRAGVRYRSFYIVNMIELTGKLGLVLQLAARPDVARIEANPQISNIKSQLSNLNYQTLNLKFQTSTSEPAIRNLQSAIQNQPSIEWNIQKVNAPAVWAMGYNGQGVVVAGQDTGYQWDHPALKAHYRGWDGITANHDYNWHDAIHDSVDNPCGNDSPVPCDDNAHGTHTMGTMVGDDGAGNQVGMAAGAKWMGCRNMDRGLGTPARYTECFEFFLAPYPVGGDPLAQGDPSQAPAVISNSWSCPDYEGCSALILQDVVNNVRAAGIEVVGAAQNYGSSCSTIREPIGIYSSTFTVGATDASDAIAGFSSRGPVTSDGSGRRKPDISAPGVAIRSCVPGGGYADGSTWSGTSMATPHVAGLFALVWSAVPDLVGNLATTELVITSTAVHLTTTQSCGGDTSTSVPNNVFGWGRIDALAAVQAAQPALQIGAAVSASSVLTNSPLTYTLTITNPSLASGNSNLTVTDTLPVSVTFTTASAGGVYSPAARMVTWEAPTLAPQASVTFTLVVTVGNVPSGMLIVNGDYGARSDQITRTVGGPPVTTIVGVFPYTYYLPVLFASPET